MTSVFKREGVKNRGKSTDVLVPISDLFRLMPNFRSSQNRRKVEKAVGNVFLTDLSTFYLFHKNHIS